MRRLYLFVPGAFLFVLLGLGFWLRTRSTTSPERETTKPSPTPLSSRSPGDLSDRKLGNGPRSARSDRHERNQPGPAREDEDELRRLRRASFARKAEERLRLLGIYSFKLNEANLSALEGAVAPYIALLEKLENDQNEAEKRILQDALQRGEFHAPVTYEVVTYGDEASQILIVFNDHPELARLRAAMRSLEEHARKSSNSNQGWLELNGQFQKTKLEIAKSKYEREDFFDGDMYRKTTDEKLVRFNLNDPTLMAVLTEIGKITQILQEKMDEYLRSLSQGK